MAIAYDFVNCSIASSIYARLILKKFKSSTQFSCSLVKVQATWENLVPFLNSNEKNAEYLKSSKVNRPSGTSCDYGIGKLQYFVNEIVKQLSTWRRYIFDQIPVRLPYRLIMFTWKFWLLQLFEAGSLIRLQSSFTVWSLFAQWLWKTQSLRHHEH